MFCVFKLFTNILNAQGNIASPFFRSAACLLQDANEPHTQTMRI